MSVDCPRVRGFAVFLLVLSFAGCTPAEPFGYVREQSPAERLERILYWELKRECLDHFICFGERHLDHILHEYAGFYNRHRPHQGKGNRTLSLLPCNPADGEVACNSRLGGLLRHYYLRAS